MAGHANATFPCSSLAWAGSSVCCHAARGLLCSPARTVYQDVSPRSRWWVVYSPGCSAPAATLCCGKVGDRVAARLMEQDHVIAIDDPGAAEAHPHAPAQRLGVEQSIRQWIWNEEPADSS